MHHRLDRVWIRIENDPHIHRFGKGQRKNPRLIVISGLGDPHRHIGEFLGHRLGHLPRDPVIVPLDKDHRNNELHRHHWHQKDKRRPPVKAARHELFEPGEKHT